MKIQSCNLLRSYYQTDIRRKKGAEYDCNFIGTYYNHKEDRINGFFELYHGDKPNIENFLPSLLKIAEDDQAIYELLQNAADCGATDFFIFYDKDYFVAINNGDPFSQSDVFSILNIANTTKTNNCEKIGRFGIGFKLVHKLVGISDGVDELINEHKGPILFSWSKKEDFDSFLTLGETPFQELEIASDLLDNSLPWLFKVIITNFPCGPGEKVKNINYEEQILFQEKELKSAADFLRRHNKQFTPRINKNWLDTGSMFLIKLGKDKEKLLDKNKADLVAGMQFSMNFLRKLNAVTFNNQSLLKYPIKLISFNIEKNTEVFNVISPGNKDCNISISFGYTNYTNAGEIKKSPNFYKYFPLGDETNGFSFIIHSDAFDNESNRRKLHESIINKQLLSVVATMLIDTLEKYKDGNKQEFLSIYANILISEIPDNQNNKWLNEPFYNKLLSYLKTNIPTTQGIKTATTQVKIKSFNLDVLPSEFGLNETYWFYFKIENDALLKEASSPDKLGLEKWTIRDLFNNAPQEVLNDWIMRAESKKYTSFLKDLDNEYLTIETLDKLMHTKLFRVSDGNFYSFADVEKKADVIFKTPKTAYISGILQKIGFLVSDLIITDYKFYTQIESGVKTEKDVYKSISAKTPGNVLSPEEKHILFRSLSSGDTKFKEIGAETLKDLILFKNTHNNNKPLGQMLPAQLKVPDWLVGFKISEDEYDSYLDVYLLKEKDIYQQLIIPFWSDIIKRINTPKSFYEEIIRYSSLDNHAPSLPSQLPIVLTKKGFKPASDIFYHPELTDVKRYNFLQSVIEKLSKKHLPISQIVLYLKSFPFNQNSSTLDNLDLVEMAPLELDEVLSFADLAVKNHINLFYHFNIEKKEDNYFIHHRKERVFQYFTDNDDIKKLIDSAVSVKVKLLGLPKELSDLSFQIGVIKDDELYKILLQNIEMNEPLAIALIDYVESPDLQAIILERIQSIQLNTSKKYTNDSLEAKLLNMACKVQMSSEQLSNFRNKIVVIAGESRLGFNNISSRQKDIEFENSKYILPMNMIFPERNESDNHLKNIVATFSNTGLNSEKLEYVFGLENRSYDEILKDIGFEITNAHQLAFILLYHINTKPLNLSEYFVDTEDPHNFYSLDNNFYTQAYSFIKSYSILSKSCRGICDILEFPITIKDSSLYIDKVPRFNEEKFYTEDIKENLTDDERSQITEIIFQKWSENGNWDFLIKDRLFMLLGFNPFLKVYSKDLAITDELLPFYFQSWLDNNPQRFSFIAGLGINIQNSSIINIRQFFKNNNSEIEENIPDNLDGQLLINTLIWLEENHITFNTIPALNVFSNLIERINVKKDSSVLEIERHIDLPDSLTAPELDTEYYLSWKEEIDNKYRIFLYEGLIPEIVKLNDRDYSFGHIANENVFITIDNRIFLNSKADIDQLLYEVALANKDLREDFFKLIIIRNQSNEPSEEYKADLAEKGERILYNYLKNQYAGQGQVIWLNCDTEQQFLESFGKYDFEIRDEKDEVVCYIECKGTSGIKPTFYLTKNEWNFFLEHRDQYQIYRVFNINSTPNFVCIDNLFKWLETGKVVPYLVTDEKINKERVFLTIFPKI